MRKFLLILLLSFSHYLMAQPIFRDPAFATNGLLELAGSSYTLLADMHILSNDKILLVQSGPGITRLHPDGAMDNSYGTAGVAAFSPLISNWYSYKTMLDTEENCWILSNGNQGSTQVSSIVKIDSTGNPDGSFGSSGEAMFTYPGLDISSYVFDIQDDGKIMVAGYWANPLMPVAINGYFLARLLPNGSIDTSYGYQGFQTTPLDPLGDIFDIEITTTNQVLLLARRDSPNICTVMAFDSTGVVDSTYGMDGMAEIPGDPFFTGNSYSSIRMLPMPGEQLTIVGQKMDATTGVYTYELDDNGFLQMVNNDTTSLILIDASLSDAILTAGNDLYLSTTNFMMGTMFKMDSLRQQDLVFANNGTLTEVGNHTNYALVHIGMQSDQKILFAGLYDDASIPESGAIISRYYNSSIGLENETGYSFRIFPNPSTDHVFVSLSAPDDVIQQMSVTDMTGKSIHLPVQQDQSIDVSTFPAGIYFIDVQTNKGRGVRKLVVE
jgi:uncharacterized delta-60 repeat protein